MNGMKYTKHVNNNWCDFTLQFPNTTELKAKSMYLLLNFNITVVWEKFGVKKFSSKAGCDKN